MEVGRSHHYKSSICEIDFAKDASGTLTVTIDTERLHLRPVTEKDTAPYFALFTNKEVMEKYQDGKLKTFEDVTEYINKWVKRWKESDPYSGFAVFKKNSKEFVGHVALGHGDNPGEAEIGGLGFKPFWGDHLGTEAALAIIKEYVPSTVQEGYTLEGKTITKICATARTDNRGSNAILEKYLGMHLDKIEEKYEGNRNHYSITLEELTKNKV